MKAHFSNLKVINYHPAGNRVHANFDNDLQEALEKDTQVDSEDDELTQMLSQRNTLLTRTTRALGDADWTNDGQNETQARFVDSEGEDLPTDPSEAVLSQNRTDQPPPDQPSPEQSDESDDEDEKEREFNRNKQLHIVASLAKLVPLILQHLEDQARHHQREKAGLRQPKERGKEKAGENGQESSPQVNLVMYL